MIFRSAKAEFCESLLQPGELVCPIFRLGLRTQERNRPGTAILVQLAGVSRQKQVWDHGARKLRAIDYVAIDVE
jgi:hypothetical protein